MPIAPVPVGTIASEAAGEGFVPDRAATVAEWNRRGVQLGEVIQYSVPHLGAYLGPTCSEFPNSLLASRHLVNFPINVTARTARAVVARSRRT